MKKSISIILLLMIILINSVVYAETLNIEVTSNKQRVEKDEEIIVTVNWKEGMQAADFILNYDDKKFEFIESDIGEFCLAENSKVRVAWVSIDDTYKTNITFKFKAINSGKSDFSVQIDGGFSNGEFDTSTNELKMPDNYNISNAKVKVNGFSMIYAIPVIIAILAIIVVIIIKKRK